MAQRAARRTNTGKAATTADGGTRCGGGAWGHGGDGCGSQMEVPRRSGVSQGRSTWALWLGASGTAVRKDRRPAQPKELGDEDGGMALRLGAIDPLQRVRACRACGVC